MTHGSRKENPFHPNFYKQSNIRGFLSLSFSKDYAASTWCLDEMAAIAECHAELKQTVFPVFYDVDTSHVRQQNGVYQNAFVLHTEQFKHDPGKVDRWKRAMTCLAGLAGWDIRNKMDLSNSKNLKMTPCFEGIQNLERLDLTGCINLAQVDSSIELLTELVFLSLQNCTSLVSLDFSWGSRLSCLRVLRLFGCTKLRKTQDFTGALNLEYLDMDQCTNLFRIHKSIGALVKLKFLSLRDCTNLVRISDNFKKMTSLITLDLSFCDISKVPNAIGELRCLERLNLQGNRFDTLPSTIKRLYSLAYLNLSHCQRLQYLPELPTKSAPSVGRYFKTTSGSHDHRSGLYIFDCPRIVEGSIISPMFALSDRKNHLFFTHFCFGWLQRLLKEPRHFRCGFDIVLPWHWKDTTIPRWFFHQRFKGVSIIRIKHSNMHVDWVGFVFCVAFEVNNHPAISGSPHHLPSLPLPYSFYLSFESEHMEKRFDIPLSMELNKVDGSNYIWAIYISRQHCHFVKTGGRITFKARQSLIMKEWGLHVLTKKDIEGSGRTQRTQLPLPVIDKVEERSSSLEHKIQLPYNWLVSDEDEVENYETKGKEINLSNLGLLSGIPQ